MCQNIGNPDCYGSVVGINGNIYGVPGGGSIIWEYSLRENIVKPLFELSEYGYAKCAGGGVGLDGTIVFMPCFGEYVYFIKNNDSMYIDADNRFFNTCY